MPISKSFIFYSITLIVFALLALALFSVIEPLNGAPSDDWVYPYYAKARNLTVEGSNRQFGLAQIVFNEIIFPGRFDLLYVWQMANVVIVAMCLFHLARRLGLGEAFGVLLGFVYLLYIPNNPDQARVLYSAGLYTFITLMGVSAITLLVESTFWRGWPFWMFAVAAALLGYATARAYESWIPVLLLAPVLWLFLPRLAFGRSWLALAIWWSGTGIGSLQFLIPYLQNDETVRYQQLFNDGSSIALSDIIYQLFQFYRQSFWLRDFLRIETAYLIPSLGIAALCLVGWWALRRYWGDFRLLLSWRVLLAALVGGLVWVGFSGAAFAFAGMELRRTYRANFFAAPGQALVVVVVILFLTRVLCRWARLPQMATTSLCIAVLGFWGGQWYYQAQQHAEAFNQRTRSFEASYQFFRDLQANVPQWQDHTLLVWTCRRAGAYRWATIDVLGPRYVYNNDVLMGVPQDIIFDETGVLYQHPSPSLRIEARYTYDEVVLLGCRDDQVIILEDWLDELPPQGREQYQPMARVISQTN